MDSDCLKRKAFTLIELLVVIAIIAILSVIVILTLNPAELLRQSRDSQRLSDLGTLTSALNLVVTDQGGTASFNIGTSSVVYLSTSDPSATTTAGSDCTNLGITNYIFSDNFNSLSAGNVTGQNGWTAGDPTNSAGAYGNWVTAPATGIGSGMAWSPTGVAYNFSIQDMENGLSTLTSQKLQADFDITGAIVNYSPQFWGRKTANTGDAGGYGAYYQGGALYLFTHVAGTGGASVTLTTTSSPITLATGTWYTGVFQVTNSTTGTPILSFYFYPKGGAVPSQPQITVADASATFSSGYFGLGTVYYPIQYTNVSVQASSSAPITGYYHCAASSTIRNVNGTGWVPANLTKFSSGAPIGSLPVDPVNQTSSGLYYSYKGNGTLFRLSATPESQKYATQLLANPLLFSAGSSLSL